MEETHSSTAEESLELFDCSEVRYELSLFPNAFSDAYRIAPLPPHWVVNMVAPHLGIQPGMFWLSTFLGVIGTSYIVSQHWRWYGTRLRQHLARFYRHRSRFNDKFGRFSPYIRMLSVMRNIYAKKGRVS